MLAISSIARVANALVKLQVLTAIFKDYIPFSVLLARGASRGVLGVELDAAPAAVVRSHGLGRSGVTVRAHYGALLLDGWTGAGESGRKPAGYLPSTRKRGPPNRKAAMARRKAMRGCWRPSHGAGHPRQ